MAKYDEVEKIVIVGRLLKCFQRGILSYHEVLATDVMWELEDGAFDKLFGTYAEYLESVGGLATRLRHLSDNAHKIEMNVLRAELRDISDHLASKGS